MSIIERIHDRLTADSESESGPEGYLSWKGEWHAAAWGFAAAFFAVLVGEPTLLAGTVGWLLTSAKHHYAPAYLPYPRQFAKESAYLLGHGLAGAAVAIGVRGLLAQLPPVL